MTFFSAALAALITFIILYWVYHASLAASFVGEAVAYVLTAAVGFLLSRR